METRQAHSPSASPQPNAPPPPVFPHDLIIEILSWLPVKSLLKFRCVCKSWKSLISDPNFVKLHLHRSSRNPNLLLVFHDYSEDLKYYDRGVLSCSVRSLLENPSPTTFDEDYCYRFSYLVVGSCNGLVCLIRNRYPPKYCFSLWNPATKLTSKVTPLFSAAGRQYNRFAFGYDNLSDTYKVLAFTFNDEAEEESQKIQVKICSFGDNCWRNIQSFPVVPFDSDIPGLNYGVYFNGTLNWLALRNNHRWDDTSSIAQLVIVSLDLVKETYTQLLLPPLDEAPPVEPTIGVLMDCLCFSHNCKETHFVVWQMKEFGVEKSWTQFMKVCYQDLQIDCSDLKYPWLPLCMSVNDDVLIMRNFSESQAIIYHQRDCKVERTQLPFSIRWESTMDYVESLVSPCCD